MTRARATFDLPERANGRVPALSSHEWWRDGHEQRALKKGQVELASRHRLKATEKGRGDRS
jgi:hypothetical protein